MRIRPQAERYNALLEERDVFDDLLLANKYFMGSEIRKRIVGQAASVSSNLIRRERNGWKSFLRPGVRLIPFQLMRSRTANGLVPMTNRVK
jgi:hypothetical protein